MEKRFATENRICRQCGKTFLFTPDASSDVRGRGKYCTDACYRKSRGDPPVEITCLCGCGRKKLVKANRVKQGFGKFFSRECASNWKARQKAKKVTDAEKA